MEIVAWSATGGPVETWNHHIQIEAIDSTRCRYSDTIEIRAGLFTIPLALFAHTIYRYRQGRWRRLAAHAARLSLRA
jgi:hypothetical protein